MTEQDLQDAMMTLIESLLEARREYLDPDENDDGNLADHARDMADAAENLEYVSTFQEAQILSSNKGLVLTMQDGTEFQITIIQSR